jgi:cytochrome c553
MRMSNTGVDQMKAIIMLGGVLLLGASSSSLAAEDRNAASGPSQQGREFFEQKIQPVLVKRCYECHSAEAPKVKGGLLLDSRSGMMQGGDTGPAVVPGDPEKGRLMQAIRYADADLQMPPKEKLSSQQIVDFEAWIKMGAPDPRGESAVGASASSYGRVTNHWAFKPFKDPPIPKVKNGTWPKQPLDSFILAELEDKKLTPAPPPDKRALLRRVTFDLTGLPPKPAEVEAFLNDNTTEAIAKVVDRLLDSPHFGERWGRHWLDVARYADSNGLENNVPYPNAWRYRDYVVESFNQGKPFDQFIREQLAGDLLPFQSDDQRFELLTATGFLVLGPKSLSEPNQLKLVMDVADEQIDVTSRAFLGLTVGCARCHDHKFDPIPSKDYYALAGIFKSTATLSTGSRQNPNGPRWMERPLATADKAKAIEDYDKKIGKLTEELRMAQENPGGILSAKLPGIVVDNTAAQLTGRWKESIGSTNFVDKNYHHDANSDKGMMSARFVPKLPHMGAYEVLVSYTPAPNRATNVPVTIQSQDGERIVLLNQKLAPTYRNAFVSIGTYQFQAGTNGCVVISNEKTKGFVVVDAVEFVPIDEWKLELSAMAEAAQEMTGAGSDRIARVMEPISKKGEPGALMPVAMANSMAMSGPLYETLQEAIYALRTNAPPRMPTAMAVQEGSVGNSRINLRGDPEKLGAEVPRGVLGILQTTSSDSPAFTESSSGRLELANWIASPANPLTARVAVNRIWLHLFGRGLVDTPDNFGSLSDKPTHPELLDYLACRFAEEGWSFKKTIRMIMLSSAYQMSCDYDAKAYAKDPDNRYLWRMNRRRLDAEAIRDAILAVSGQIDLTRGGSLNPDNNGPMNVPMRATPQIVSNRRSLYLPVVRNDVPDMFQVFDFGDPHTIAGKRHVTTAATQALFMMNSEFIQEQSRQWAQTLLALPVSDDAQRVSMAYAQAFGRPATDEETSRALRFMEKLQSGTNSSQAGSESKGPKTWQSFCQALFASTEFRFLD